MEKVIRLLIQFLPFCSLVGQQPLHNQSDVIVVGGGLAGLSAARSLTAHGYSTLVLEASDRVGGRTWTETLPDGGWIDMGGQWTGPSMHRVMALVDALGLQTFPSHCTGNNILILDGQRIEYSSADQPDFFPLPAADLAEYASILKTIDALADEIPIEAPWNAPHAEEWDKQTVASWMEDHIVTPGARFLFRAFTVGYFSSEPSDVSLLHLLFYVRAGHGFQKVHFLGNGLRILGGAQEIAKKMAAELGECVWLKTPVQTIDQTGDLVRVVTSQGSFEAKQVIVAMAPPLAARIVYNPQLPGPRDQFSQRAPMGSIIKVHVVYPDAFWRTKGLSGKAISGDDEISFAVDNSPPNGVPGILGGFIQGKKARKWADFSEEALKKMVVETFVKYYGPEAATPLAFYKADWSEQPWIRGGFSSVMPPGVWTSFPNVVRQPIGRIHWAGTETAIGWYASMNGALSSGERAAQEVMQALEPLCADAVND